MVKMTWRNAYQQCKECIDTASELRINPDNRHAIFFACEGPVTPVIEDFVTVQGSDEQILKFYRRLFPNQAVRLDRSKYL